jgi:hypothetical protein
MSDDDPRTDDSASIPRLPDTYGRRQGRALKTALDAGDTATADRIIAHLLVEGATTPRGQAALKEQLHAMLLFREGNAAAVRGDSTTAEAIQARMRNECSPAAIKNALAAVLLRTGLREGLSADHHAKLMTWIDELRLGLRIRKVAATIRRVP